MRKNVVLALNLQQNYFEESGTSFLGPQAKDAMDRIKKYLSTLDNSWEIIYSLDIRSPGDMFFESQRTQCMVGTRDVIAVQGLKGSNHHSLISSRPSAMWATPLTHYLKKLEPASVVIIGAETNSSVLFTAGDLRCSGYPVTVPERLVVAKDEYLHNAAISIMSDTLGVCIVGEP
jgi:nicotinamidase-related amidase